MAGGTARFTTGTVMNTVKYFGVAIVSAGDIEGDAQNGDIIHVRGDGQRQYRKVVLRDGRIVGFVLSEGIEHAGVLLGLMRARVNVSSLGECLTDPDFDLIDLPPRWRQDHYDGATRLGGNGRVIDGEMVVGSRQRPTQPARA